MGEFPIAWREKNLHHCHSVHCAFHVDFIRLSAKSFIIRLLRNSINEGKRVVSSDIYSCAAWVQEAIYVQLHVNVYSVTMHFEPCILRWNSFHAENYFTKENLTGVCYENPNLKTYMYETFLESFSFDSACNVSKYYMQQSVLRN